MMERQYLMIQHFLTHTVSFPPWKNMRCVCSSRWYRAVISIGQGFRTLAPQPGFAVTHHVRDLVNHWASLGSHLLILKCRQWCVLWCLHMVIEKGTWKNEGKIKLKWVTFYKTPGILTDIRPTISLFLGTFDNSCLLLTRHSGGLSTCHVFKF